MKIYGKPLHFDIETNILEFQVSFFDETFLLDIEKAINKNRHSKVTIAGARELKNPMTYEQQKRWFVSLKLIIEFFNGYPSAENIAILHEELKKDIFPIRKINLGGITIDSVPSITSLSRDELFSAIDKLHTRYEQTGINFLSY